MLSKRRVVITGLGIVSPVGNDVATAWASILGGRSGIAPIERFDTSGFPTHFGGEIRKLELEPYMSAKDAAIDAMISELLRARDRTAFVSAVRALDRALMSGFYAIPVFNVAEQWIARWNRIERPEATALVGYLPESWWQRPDSQAK